tara:strand:- start:42 stop:230 length:189 start_codon:yes stop_codon:yes gene_type:complete
MKILDFIGSFFIYKSPLPKEGFINFLKKVPNRHLKVLAGTNSNYSKKRLIQMYLEKNKRKEI